MMLNDFKSQVLKSIPTSQVVALTEFFQADANTNVH